MSNVLNLNTHRKPARRRNAADPQASLYGNLSVVAPPDLIQWLCCANKDWKVHLWGKGLDAELIILAGQLVDARIGGLRGMPALVEIIDCHEGSFELLPISEAVEQSLQGPWQNLVLSAAQQLDERSFDRSAPPKTTETPMFELPEEKTPPVLVMLPGGNNPPENDNPSDLTGLIDAGFVALKAGNVERAKDRWNQALLLDPNNRGLRFNLRKLEEKPALAKP